MLILAVKLGEGCFMKFLAFALLLIPAFAQAEENNLNDLFPVKEIEGSHAVVEGKVMSLKPGQYLYFIRSPFRFQIESISGNKITVKLPASHDLKVGQGLVRNATDSMKKSMDTEKRLKSALEE